MNDDLMFEYLVQMGQMRPEEAELKKKQAMVDALRGNSMKPMEGQMVGKHYVSPGIAGALSQLGQAYFASQGQQGVDAGIKGMNERQRMALEELRKKRRGGGMGINLSASPAGYQDPYANLPTYGNEA
jgi:hypothetical protein